MSYLHTINDPIRFTPVAVVAALVLCLACCLAISKCQRYARETANWSRYRMRYSHEEASPFLGTAWSVRRGTYRV